MQIQQATGAGYLPVWRSVASNPARDKQSSIHCPLDYAAQSPFKFNWPEKQAS